MKKIKFLLLLATIVLGFGCKKSDDIYSFYRRSHPQNFITTRGAELYAYTADDSVLVRADYFIRIIGQIKTYGDHVYQYGHCWHPSNPNPVIGIDTLMTINPSEFSQPGPDTLSFKSSATRLNPNTRYYIRSYIITQDDNGNVIDTGYNPIVTEVYTKNAIDEWFSRNGEIGVERPGGTVFDALAFNFGDTVIFGTGDQGEGNLSNAIWMYDPKTRLWDGNFKSLPSILYNPPSSMGAAFADGIGFGIEFTDINAPSGQKTRCIYVGLGDYVGDNQFTSKSNIILEYEFDQNPNNDNWTPVETFAGGKRSGAVCFVIGNRAYIGTGSSPNPLSSWFVFIPEYDRDGSSSTSPWRNMGLNIPGGDNSIPRTGAIAFSVNGRGYFGLGIDENGNFLNDFWEFRPNSIDPVNGTWTRKADFPGAPRRNAVAFAVGNQGYVGTGDNIVGDMEVSYTGDFFEDFYRYDPFNNRWFKMRDYTINTITNPTNSKKVTRAVGFSSAVDNVGYIGFGIVPNDTVNRAQEDLWMYRPFISGAK